MNFFLQIGHLVSFPTFIMLLLLITLLNTNLLYLWLEGTLYNLVIFYHAELLTIRRLAIDLQVQYEIL